MLADYLDGIQEPEATLTDWNLSSYSIFFDKYIIMD